MDFALLVKQGQQQDAHDPVTSLMTAKTKNHDYPILPPEYNVVVKNEKTQESASTSSSSSFEQSMHEQHAGIKQSLLLARREKEKVKKVSRENFARYSPPLTDLLLIVCIVRKMREKVLQVGNVLG